MLVPRNAYFCMGADPWTTDLDIVTQLFVCLNLSYLSVSFIWSCISRLGSLNYRLNYIIACSENQCLTCPKPALSFCSSLLVLLLKELYRHWRVWKARSQAVSEHLLIVLAFSLSVGIPLSSTGTEAVNYRIVWCRKEPVVWKPVRSNKPLRLGWLLRAYIHWSSKLGFFRCSPLLWRNCPRESQITQVAVLPRPLSWKDFPQS